MKTRRAVIGDAAGMSRVLEEIVIQTGRERRSDRAFVVANYLEHPARIRCTVAVDEESGVVGFQSLVRAWPDNPYDVPEGWGIVGTYISPRAHRRGVGSALFAETKAAAQNAGLAKIDAFIGSDNHAALRYYEAMGFETYRDVGDAVQKAYDVAAKR